MSDAATDAKQTMFRSVGRTMSRLDARAANPEATAEEIKGQWQENRADYIKKARVLLNALEKQGFTITPPETVSEED